MKRRESDLVMRRLALLVCFLVFTLNSAVLMSQTEIQKVEYLGWPNCYRLNNGVIELVATADVGPRIIHVGFSGQKNLFGVFQESAGQTGASRWIIYGGHRLWHAPEDKVRTYEPDNSPVKVETIANGIRLIPEVEPRTGIQKTLEVTMDPSRGEVRVVHRLENTNLWAIRLAAWALSVMARDGFAILPLPTRYHPDRLLPNRTISLWPYTDMRDPRYLWGKDYILVKQVADTNPTKIGVNDSEEWAAYYLEPFLFLKQFDFAENAEYPDFHSSVEVYTNSRMLELETVGPLRKLEPGEELVHEERWQLFRDLKLGFGEEDIRAKVLPLVQGR